MDDEANAVIARAAHWLIDDVLPLWASAGFDARHGRFFEQLDATGQPRLETAHRAHTQARQIYVYAHAALLGWYPEGRELVRIATNALLSDFRGAEGSAGFVQAIARDGTVADDLRDTATHGSVLFGLAWAFWLLGDENFIVEADRTIAYLDGVLPGANGEGYADSAPAGPLRHQLPHLRVFEAFLALDAAAPGRGYLQRAGTLYELFVKRFYDSDTHTPVDTLDQSLQPVAPADQTTTAPGHVFEWVWLLRAYGARAHVDVSPYADALEASAMAREHPPGAAPAAQVWTQAAAVTAAVAQHRAGHAHSASRVTTLLSNLMTKRANRPVRGGWLETTKGATADLDATTLSYLFMAAAEAATTFATPSPAPVSERTP